MAENGNGSQYMSASIKELSVALIAAQKELPKVEKDKVNPFFQSKYAGLDTVLPAVLKVLTDHGLGLVQSVGSDQNGGSTLSTMLVHESGEWLKDTQPLLLVKSDPQSQGSAITYGRRYAAMSILGLVADEDDDGNAASNPSARRRATRAPEKAQGDVPPDTSAFDDGVAEDARRQYEETQGVPAPGRSELHPNGEDMQPDEPPNPDCPDCGGMTSYKSGEKNGRPWEGYFCDERGHKVTWIKA